MIQKPVLQNFGAQAARCTTIEARLLGLAGGGRVPHPAAAFFSRGSQSFYKALSTPYLASREARMGFQNVG